MSTPLRIVKPFVVTDAMLTATDVPEVAPAAYNGATTYPSGVTVSVAGAAGLVTVYRSLQASNTGHTPASSPTWWFAVGTVYAPYSGATTYAAGDRVQDNAAHKIYQSVAAGNIGHPLSDITNWSLVSPTNAWKLFDTSNTTQTQQSTAMRYTLQPVGAINALAALNVRGVNTVRVRLTHPIYGTIYDRTVSLASLPAETGWWPWFFGARKAPALLVLTDLPGFLGCTLIVDFTGTTDMGVGVLLFGELRSIGLGVQAGARLGIQDYSRQEENDYGDLILVQRAYAKRASFDVPILSQLVDEAYDFFASMRATPCLVIGSKKYACTVIYGLVKDFDISLPYDDISDCSLNIKGLT